MRFRTAVIAVLAVFGVANVAHAQRDVTLSVNGGYVLFADGSAFEPGGTIGGEFTYYLTPQLGIGAFTDYSFSEVDGEKFPANQLDFTDSTTFNIINQPIELWQYGVHAKLRFGEGGFIPYVMVGGGGVTVFLDSQQNDDNDSYTLMALRFGAGANFVLSESMGFQLTVHDAFFPNWKPNLLNPVRDQFQNSRFPELNPDPDELDDSVHNFVFSAALTFTPGGGG